VDGDFLPTTGFPRIDRFKEHTHRAAGGQPRRAALKEAELREALTKALEHGKGVVHVLASSTACAAR
jgi:excinuclease ABC subunit A